MASDVKTPRRSTPLSSLTQAVLDISRADSTDEVVERIRLTARSLIGCQGIAVILKDGDLCHYVEEDAIGALWKGHKFPASACVSGWAMINAQTAIVPDIAKDERIPYELYADTFVRSLVMAPVGADEPVAAIGAYWDQPYSPTDWEIEVLEALASAAASAIDNAQLIGVLGKRPSEAPAAVDVPVAEKPSDLARDLERVGSIAAVPMILDVVLRMTGMGFAAVARVTDTKWIACQVLDHLAFGLAVGGELPLQSTLCDEIRGHREPVVIDDVDSDPIYRDHHTPRVYGLKSYISVPIILASGEFFGTLCAIDPNPAKVNNAQVLGTFKLFADLIAHHLDAADRLDAAAMSLQTEQELAELRERFIAVLGHDLRNPIAALDAGTSRLLREGWTARSPTLLSLMRSSIGRMSDLVESITDLARVRLGGGISINVSEGDIAATLTQVVDELKLAHPGRDIASSFNFTGAIAVDHHRIAQMISNLVANAIVHGSETTVVVVTGCIVGKSLEVSVTNGGRPIALDQIDKVFLPFRRGPGEERTGLGLGLYIASQIASAHGGRINVTSNERQTCFTFRMPIALHGAARSLIEASSAN